VATEAATIVDRLTVAACAAIANERPGLEHPAGGIRGLTLELILAPDGQVAEACCYLERRSKGAALLARRGGPG
jgi:hypothetical protein